MTPVRGKRGVLTHVTEDVRRTLCQRRCDGWIVLDFEPRKQPHLVSCRDCREIVEFN